MGKCVLVIADMRLGIVKEDITARFCTLCLSVFVCLCVSSCISECVRLYVLVNNIYVYMCLYIVSLSLVKTFR